MIRAVRRSPENIPQRFRLVLECWPTWPSWLRPKKREKKIALTPIERRTQSPQLNQLPLSPKWCQALYSGHWTLYTVCRLISLVTSKLVTLVTNWGLVAADSAVDFASHIRRARV